MIRRVSAIAGKDTLILFTSDHSFGLRMGGGERETPLAGQYAAENQKSGVTHVTNSLIRIEEGHTGEEVIAAASGPGSDKVRGFLPNSRLFDVSSRRSAGRRLAEICPSFRASHVLKR